MLPKPKTPRDPKYIKWLKTFPCCVCGIDPAEESHHENEDGQAAMGLKTSDYRALPLCVPCHRQRHTKGRSFFKDINAEEIISNLNAIYRTKNNCPNFYPD